MHLPVSSLCNSGMHLQSEVFTKHFLNSMIWTYNIMDYVLINKIDFVPVESR